MHSPDYNELVRLNQLIGERIDLIASRTAQMAMVGSADTSNPEFVEIMGLQNQLIEKSDQLLEKLKNLESI